MHQVVFTGRLLKGAERASVEAELQRLFRATPRQVEWFLRGKAIVVKSTDDEALATRYHAALIKAGLECELRSDQPATEPMAPPPETSPASQQQLPIPDVTQVLPKSEPKPARPAVPRRAPTLGPVTQAITAQDRAPAFVATSRPGTATPVPTAGRASSPLRSRLWLLFLLLGAVLVGALAYGVRQQWLAQQPAGSATMPGSAGPGAAPGETPATTREARARPEVPAEAETHTALIVGRWQCVEAASGRVVENEFGADGRYRSLAHGRPDAFQQIDQLDVLVEGRYRLDGDTVVLHVQNIPSREFFGGPARADDYLFWRIDSLTREALVWSDSQLQEIRESCLRSQSLSPG